MAGRGVLPVLAGAVAMTVACADTAFDLQGHRGARGLKPENTLPAFAHALSLGVTTLELDTLVTADGVVVVTHNPILEPYMARRDGKWINKPGPAVRALSLSELQTYDVGRLKPRSRYALQYRKQSPVDGTTVPTLAQVFDLVKRAGNAAVRFNIEAKLMPSEPDLTPSPEAFADAVLQVARDAGMISRLTLQSFDWRFQQAVQRLTPDVPTSYLTVSQPWLDNLELGKPGASAWLGGLDLDDHGGSVPRLVKAAGGAVWSPYHGELSKDLIDEAHNLGLRVIPWTVNDAARMVALMDFGVDGLITDYPDRLRGVMEERGMDLPRATPVAP